MGINLIPVELPKLPYGAMVPLLTAEAAAAFDDLTLSGRDRLLTEQGIEDWPNDFRVARFYPAVEYIQANRARTLAIQQVSALFQRSRHHRHTNNGQAATGDKSHWSSRNHLAQWTARRLMLPSRQKSTTATMTTSEAPELRFRSRSWQAITTTPN